MKRYQNISLCQIDIKTGQSEYYIPKNSNWANAKIEKIVAYLPFISVVASSPINDAQVYNGNAVADLYFDLYNADGVNIMHNTHVFQLSDVNNYPPEIGCKLSYELSRIFFSTPPVADGALMLYIFYGATDVQNEDPCETVTVTFPVTAKSKISLTEVIERYMYANNKGVKRITVWNGRQAPYFYHTGYMTLRDKSGRLAHEFIPNFFLRPQLETPNGDPELANPILLNCVELDFNNTFLYNTTSSNLDYTVTFYY